MLLPGEPRTISIIVPSLKTSPVVRVGVTGAFVALDRARFIGTPDARNNVDSGLHPSWGNSKNVEDEWGKR